jgi:hypothetical protein
LFVESLHTRRNAWYLLILFQEASGFRVVALEMTSACPAVELEIQADLGVKFIPAGIERPIGGRARRHWPLRVCHERLCHGIERADHARAFLSRLRLASVSVSTFWAAVSDPSQGWRRLDVELRVRKKQIPLCRPVLPRGRRQLAPRLLRCRSLPTTRGMGQQRTCRRFATLCHRRARYAIKGVTTALRTFVLTQEARSKEETPKCHHHPPLLRTFSFAALKHEPVSSPASCSA